MRHGRSNRASVLARAQRLSLELLLRKDCARMIEPSRRADRLVQCQASTQLVETAMFSAVAGKQTMSRMYRSICSVLLMSLLGCATVAPAFAQGTTLVLLNLTDSWRYNHADCLDGIPSTAPGYDDSTVNWVSGPGGFTGGETRTEALPRVTRAVPPAPRHASCKAFTCATADRPSASKS